MLESRVPTIGSVEGMGYIQELYGIGQRKVKEPADKARQREKLPAGVKVGWCPFCQCWYNLEETMQFYCPAHGNYLDDVHISATKYSKWLPYPQ